MPPDFPHLLALLEPGTVRLVVGDPAAVEAWAAAEIEADDAGRRLVSIRFSRLPGVSTLVDRIIAGLADAALALWPDWCEPPTELDARGDDRAAVGLLAGWRERAARSASRGRAPILSGLPAALQARQLAALLSPHRIYLMLGVSDPAPSHERLSALAAGAEWAAGVIGAAAAVVASAEAARLPPLQRWPIATTTLDLHDHERPSLRSGEPAAMTSPDFESPDSETPVNGVTSRVEEAGVGPRAGRSATRPQPARRPKSLGPSAATTAPVTRDETVAVDPIIGRPHPHSPGEQLLAQTLASDAELAGLFAFNQPLRPRSSRYIVDLLWNAGRVVVEVDGYRAHAGRERFFLDRHRDFELTTAGYLVLRVPHEEVWSDVGAAVQKIRELVRFRLRHPFREEAGP